MKRNRIIKFFGLILAFSLLSFGMLSCAEQAADDGKLNIVCTVFPQYDWLRNIIGEDNDAIALKLIVKNGSDLHSYQATARDIVDISSADMLVYVGGESDAWVEDAIAQTANENMLKLDMLSLLSDRAIHTDDHEHEHEHDHEHEHTYDEHVWLSLKNADILCRALSDKLCELDPERRDSYTENVSAYCEKLAALDNAYAQTVANATQNTLLFADRFPFAYLMNDYGIKYYAAFPGCSADSEASFETVTFLASKIDELSLSCVITVDFGSTNIAPSVISSSQVKDCKTLNLLSMQAIKQSDIDNGATYLSVMEQNQKVLAEALS